LTWHRVAQGFNGFSLNGNDGVSLPLWGGAGGGGNRPRAFICDWPAATFAHLNETGRLAGALKHPVIAAGGQWASLAHTLRLVR